MPRPTRIAIALTLVSLVAGACGPARSLSTDRLEEDIADVVLTDYDQSAIAVDCPSGIEAGEGREFFCAVTFEDDTKLTYRVTQVDDDGRISFEPTMAVIDPVRPAAAIANEFISDRGVNVDVECGDPDDPDRLLILEVDKSFRCRATRRDGKVIPARVRVTGLDGSFSFEILG